MDLRTISGLGDLPTYYSFLKEAVESWKHVVTDKLVYSEEFSSGNYDPFTLVSKQNIELDRWIELDLRLSGERKTHYAAIVRPARNGCHIGWVSNLDLGLGLTERNPSMLIDIPEPVQLPQFREFVSIPTVVWLQRIDDGQCGGSDTHSGPFEALSTIGVVHADDRETCGQIRRSSGYSGKFPRKVVERSPQTGYEITQHQAQIGREGVNFEDYEVLSSLKVILGRNSMGVAIQKPKDRFVESVKVFLRPTYLQAGIRNSWHAAQR